MTVFFFNSPIFVLVCFVFPKGTMNLVVVIIIFGVAVKVYRNFGGGLAQHCKCLKFIIFSK